jgi:hypothetical protein
LDRMRSRWEDLEGEEHIWYADTNNFSGKVANRFEWAYIKDNR